MGALVDAPSATIEATVAEVAEEEDDGTIVTVVRSGVTSLATGAGGSSLARIDLRAMQPYLHCLHRQEGRKITTRTRGLGASKSLGPLPASWAARRPQLPTASSSSLRVR